MGRDMLTFEPFLGRNDPFTIRDLKACIDCTLERGKDPCTRCGPVEPYIEDCTVLPWFLCFCGKKKARQVCCGRVGS